MGKAKIKSTVERGNVQRLLKMATALFEVPGWTLPSIVEKQEVIPKLAPKQKKVEQKEVMKKKKKDKGKREGPPVQDDRAEAVGEKKTKKISKKVVSKTDDERARNQPPKRAREERMEESGTTKRKKMRPPTVHRQQDAEGLNEEEKDGDSSMHIEERHGRVTNALQKLIGNSEPPTEKVIMPINGTKTSKWLPIGMKKDETADVVKETVKVTDKKQNLTEEQRLEKMAKREKKRVTRLLAMENNPNHDRKSDVKITFVRAVSPDENTKTAIIEARRQVDELEQKARLVKQVEWKANRARKLLLSKKAASEYDGSVESDTEQAESALTPMQRKMRNKLSGSMFRDTNEKFYTQTGAESFTLVKSSPELFKDYHKGFREQVKKWPLNPVKRLIERLFTLPGDAIQVADMGAGDARIGRLLENDASYTVHSFDLAALNPFVTVCDMAEVPLESGTVDVCIFCLSLMGTDYPKYLAEAARILKPE